MSFVGNLVLYPVVKENIIGYDLTKFHQSSSADFNDAHSFGPLCE